MAGTTDEAVIHADFAAAAAACQYFWIDTLVLYKNRGPGKAGNQVYCTRGTRVFFGFQGKSFPLNTVLGAVNTEATGGYPPQSCSLRFGNNGMDKVNLPVPDGVQGPTSYDNSCLLFERRAMSRELLNV